MDEDIEAGIEGILDGSNIHSSRSSFVPLFVVGGRFGSDGCSSAVEVSLRLSAVGMSVARTYC